MRKVGVPVDRQGYGLPRAAASGQVEIDVRTFAEHEMSAGSESGGVAVWAPPKPIATAALDFPDPDVFEVQVLSEEEGPRLVAAIELVSPANKDRPEHRRAFVAKCAALLQNRVSVMVVDLVTTRNFNLYGDLLELIGQADPTLGPSRPRCTSRQVSRHSCRSRRTSTACAISDSSTAPISSAKGRAGWC